MKKSIMYKSDLTGKEVELKLIEVVENIYYDEVDMLQDIFGSDIPPYINFIGDEAYLTKGTKLYYGENPYNEACIVVGLNGKDELDVCDIDNRIRYI